MKTSELTGAALNWAVLKAQGQDFTDFNLKYMDAYPFSTDWSQGGPIIDNKKIKIDPRNGQWVATIWNEASTQNPSYGPTPLIAAMRCLVASELGDEVEIPKGLENV
jgi:hypothetical protein